MSADMRVMAEERFIDIHNQMKKAVARKFRNGEASIGVTNAEHYELTEMFRLYVAGRIWLARKRYIPIPNL